MDVRLIAAYNGGHIVFDVLHRVRPQRVLLDHLQTGLIQQGPDIRLLPVKPDGAALRPPVDEVDQTVDHILIALRPQGVGVPLGHQGGAVRLDRAVFPGQHRGAAGQQQGYRQRPGEDPSLHVSPPGAVTFPAPRR